ncbi:NifX-associated nitrogen fixation protein [Cereibacter sphaeroides]|uniref:NifX-associated nitrogen fixation protein n=1 Tax=Rhodobacterales TaxID=204455 RepID=UPI000BBE5E91|nr:MULTISPECIES: NifX-associated nitrogen fixation protein [Paracoccaceae]MCE6950080.1 NifX-associated nitrogen fixation protein [Cereibacter sphaeroides]MCE6958204.1 NifX-associated nitrogen fixation protein [Cereibacter sphaeroides]MCE6967683.1 NifX-associated nitrogen fixation protein [Cereibacter sphaeroides]MCE6972494.1 NifX-associated nitrogen fixation protein [Cereibacter sphaeroides]
MSDTETLPRGGLYPKSDYLNQLASIIRAQDSYGHWDGKSDAELLAEYIVTPEERREIPIICDPEPEVIARIEKFYDAVGLLVEKRTGVMAGQMAKINHEGFGRIVLIGGSLVLISKHLRDVHRFGFATYEKLAEAGEKLTADAVKKIETYPDAARD